VNDSSDTESKLRQLAELLLDALPLQAAEPSMEFPDPRIPSNLPIVIVDVTNRPDVADLGRVLNSEGTAPSESITSAWEAFLDPRPVIVWRCVAEYPARCSFHVAFEFRAHYAMLLAVVKTPRLVFLVRSAVEGFRQSFMVLKLEESVLSLRQALLAAAEGERR
jgi:hypothetical protein